MTGTLVPDPTALGPAEEQPVTDHRQTGGHHQGRQLLDTLHHGAWISDG